MRIAVFGTGGAGGYFGARLAVAGEDVTFIARGPHLKAIYDEGLIVETPDDVYKTEPGRATEDPGSIGSVDVILLGVKAHQVPHAAEAIRPLLGSGTMVVTLQNGVEATGQLSAALGEDHVVGGLCGTISMITAPGTIRSVGRENFIKFGELDNNASARTTRLRDAFVRAGVAVEIPDDIHGALWEKFLFVVSWGGVGAITRAPIGVIREVPETRQMLSASLEEIAAVAVGSGVALRKTAAEDALRLLDSLAPDGTTSLQRDIVEHRPSELETWNGAVVRIGRRVDVPTPTHTFIYQSLLPQERRARGEFSFW